MNLEATAIDDCPMSVSNDKVSVVTPFFNEAPYLGECIKSVLGQTHANFEYILVDNHSTDGSSEIAEAHAQRDPRIRIVRPPEHLNQLPNHDFGLSAMSGDSAFCKIVQGDDWLYPHCLELMVQRMQAHPSAGLVSAFTMLERGVYLTGLHPSEPFLSGREIARRFLRDGLYVFGSPTAQLFRTDLVRDRQPFYSEDAHPFADVDACLAVLRESDFGFVHQVLTFTRRSNESLTSQRSRYHNSLLLTRYAMFLRHGERFFERDELEECRKRLTREYYRSLGVSFWRLLPRDFWELQRRCLVGAGSQLSRARVAGAIGQELLRLALNPLNSIQRLTGRARARQRQVSGARRAD